MGLGPSCFRPEPAAGKQKQRGRHGNSADSAGVKERGHAASNIMAKGGPGCPTANAGQATATQTAAGKAAPINPLAAFREAPADGSCCPGGVRITTPSGAMHELMALGPPRAPNEDERALTAKAVNLDFLRTNPCPELDAVLRALCAVFDAPYASVALYADGRCWLCNTVSIPTGDLPWRFSACPWNLTVTQPQALICGDLAEDSRFSEQPWTRDGLRCYCSAPLLASNGHRLGTVCFMDDQPRKVDASMCRVLNNFGELAVRVLERHVGLAHRLRAARAALPPRLSHLLAAAEGSAQARAGAGGMGVGGGGGLMTVGCTSGDGGASSCSGYGSAWSGPAGRSHASGDGMVQAAVLATNMSSPAGGPEYGPTPGPEYGVYKGGAVTTDPPDEVLLVNAFWRQLRSHERTTEACVLLVDTSQPGWPVVFADETWRLWSGYSRDVILGKPLASVVMPATPAVAPPRWEYLQQEVARGARFVVPRMAAVSPAGLGLRPGQCPPGTCTAMGTPVDTAATSACSSADAVQTDPVTGKPVAVESVRRKDGGRSSTAVAHDLDGASSSGESASTSRTLPQPHPPHGRSRLQGLPGAAIAAAEATSPAAGKPGAAAGGEGQASGIGASGASPGAMRSATSFGSVGVMQAHSSEVPQDPDHTEVLLEQLVVLDGETRKMQHNAAAEAARVSGLELHHPASGTPQRPAAKGVSTSATPWASGQYQADSGNTNTRAHGHEALPVHAAHVPAGAGAAAGEAACAQEGAGKGLLDTASQLEGVSGRLGGAKSVGGVSGGMFDLSFRPAALDLLDADTLPLGVPSHVPMSAQPRMLALYAVRVHPPGVLLPPPEPLAPGIRVLRQPEAAPQRLGAHFFPGLVLNHVLGAGGYGVAYHGRWHDTDVVLKVQDHKLKNEEELRTAQLEVSLGQMLEHPNLVRTIGHAAAEMPAPAGSGRSSLEKQRRPSKGSPPEGKDKKGQGKQGSSSKASPAGTATKGPSPARSGPKEQQPQRPQQPQQESVTAAAGAAAAGPAGEGGEKLAGAVPEAGKGAGGGESPLETLQEEEAEDSRGGEGGPQGPGPAPVPEEDECGEDFWFSNCPPEGYRPRPGGLLACVASATAAGAAARAAAQAKAASGVAGGAAAAKGAGEGAGDDAAQQQAAAAAGAEPGSQKSLAWGASSALLSDFSAAPGCIIPSAHLLINAVSLGSFALPLSNFGPPGSSRETGGYGTGGYEMASSGDEEPGVEGFSRGSNAWDVMCDGAGTAAAADHHHREPQQQHQRVPRSYVDSRAPGHGALSPILESVFSPTGSFDAPSQEHAAAAQKQLTTATDSSTNNTAAALDGVAAPAAALMGPDAASSLVGSTTTSSRTAMPAAAGVGVSSADAEVFKSCKSSNTSAVDAPVACIAEGAGGSGAATPGAEKAGLQALQQASQSEGGPSICAGAKHAGAAAAAVGAADGAQGPQDGAGQQPADVLRSLSSHASVDYCAQLQQDKAEEPPPPSPWPAGQIAYLPPGVFANAGTSASFRSHPDTQAQQRQAVGQGRAGHSEGPSPAATPPQGGAGSQGSGGASAAAAGAHAHERAGQGRGSGAGSGSGSGSAGDGAASLVTASVHAAFLEDSGTASPAGDSWSGPLAARGAGHGAGQRAQGQGRARKAAGSVGSVATSTIHLDLDAMRAAASEHAARVAAAPVKFPLHLRTLVLMEFCDGGTLQDAVDRGWLRAGTCTPSSPPDLPKQLRLALDIASALEHLHSRGVVHADLSASNVLLCKVRHAQTAQSASVFDAGTGAKAGGSISGSRNQTPGAGGVAGTPGAGAGQEVRVPLQPLHHSDMSSMGGGSSSMAHYTADTDTPDEPMHSRTGAIELPSVAMGGQATGGASDSGAAASASSGGNNSTGSKGEAAAAPKDPNSIHPPVKKFALAPLQPRSATDMAFVAKVSDFGRARLMGPEGVVRAGGYGTVTHMAPEVMDPALDALSPSADLYALGVILWQMYTGSRPYPGMSHHQILAAVITRICPLVWPAPAALGLPESGPQATLAQGIVELGRRCLEWDRKVRPSATEACAVLRALLAQAGRA